MPDPASTPDIAALIERLRETAAQVSESARRARWGEALVVRVKDPQYLHAELLAAAAALAAQQAEIERLRTRLECDGTNMAGERVSVEPYDGIAVRDVMIADLRADLAARDEENKRLRVDLAKVTDPEYLSGVIERVGLVDAEWQARAARAGARVRELRTALEPFAGYLDQAGFDLDNNGNPLPDDQGVGWVYLTHGHFRRARTAINSTEPFDA